MKSEIKKNLLKMLSKDMSDMMSEKREMPEGKKGMAVKVVAKDEEGLKKGLSKAEELLKLRGESSEDEMSEDDMLPKKLISKMEDSEEEDMEDEEMESPMHESEESEDSLEELKAQLAQLQEKIASKKA